MQISVIIPIYNAEKTLERMLESLIAQTLSDFEVLMINDGSTDNSGNICDRYSEMDDRFKVFHKNNEGVGKARQKGLEIANGKYIIHADSDDWVEPNMLELMLNAIGDSDVLITDFFSNNGTLDKIVKQCPTDCGNNITLLKDLFSGLHGNCWSKLIKKSFIEKHNICFFEGINYCEDLLFWIQAFSISDIRVKYLPKAFYHYYCPLETKTLSTNYTKKMLTQGQLLIDKMGIFLPKEIREELIIKQKLSIKCGAFEHPIYTSGEYYNIYPEVNKEILKLDTTLINRILIYLSYNRFYKTTTKLYQLKLKMRNRYVR